MSLHFSVSFVGGCGNMVAICIYHSLNTLNERKAFRLKKNFRILKQIELKG